MPSNPLQRYAHDGNRWALVTGATNGMGEEFGYQLAALGFNVILHGRNASKLAAVKSTIASKHPNVQVRTVLVDASQYPPKLEEFKAILREDSVKLTVLINNIGIVSQHYPTLEEETTEELAAQLVTNNLFPTLLASLALPYLKQNQPSLLVNMASLGAWAPTPYLSPYSGAKAYMMNFSRSLYNEMTCEKQQVDVVCLAPGQVISGMNDGPPTTMMPTSESWVKKAIASMGPRLLSKRPPSVIVPWTAHAWGARAMNWMPRSMADNAVCGVTVDLRKKKRAEKQSSKSTLEAATQAAPADSEPSKEASAVTRATAERPTTASTPNNHTDGASASDETAADEALQR